MYPQTTVCTVNPVSTYLCLKPCALGHPSSANNNAPMLVQLPCTPAGLSVCHNGMCSNARRAEGTLLSDTFFVLVQVRLSSLIGRGSFGSVFSAWKGNRPIAVKVGSMLLASHTPHPPISPTRVHALIHTDIYDFQAVEVTHGSCLSS